jgi:hypothetical protein
MQAFFGLLTIAAIVAVIVFFIRLQKKRYISIAEAQNWPSAEATVESWHAQQLAFLPSSSPKNDDLWQWSAILEYVFEAQGEYFAGSFCLAQWVENEEGCETLAARWLKQKIRIRYKPEDPQKSIFLESDGAPPGALPPELQTIQPRNNLIDLSSY